MLFHYCSWENIRIQTENYLSQWHFALICNPILNQLLIAYYILEAQGQGQIEWQSEASQKFSFFKVQFSISNVYTWTNISNWDPSP